MLQVYGSLRRYLTPAVLRHDVITLRADDICRSRRTLFAGQLTILRNSEWCAAHASTYLLSSSSLAPAIYRPSNAAQRTANLSVARKEPRDGPSETLVPCLLACCCRCSSLFTRVATWRSLLKQPHFVFFDERILPQARCLVVAHPSHLVVHPPT